MRGAVNYLLSFVNDILNMSKPADNCECYEGLSFI